MKTKTKIKGIVFFLLLVLFIFYYQIEITDTQDSTQKEMIPLCSVDWWKTAAPKDVQVILKDKQKYIKQCEINQKSHLDKDILLDAATWGKPASVEILLQHGFDKVVNESLHGWTPLHVAVNYQPDETVIEMISLLHKYGANMNLAPYGSVVDSRLPPGPGHSIWSSAIHTHREQSVKIKIINTLLKLGLDPRTPSPGNASIGLGLALMLSPWPIVEAILSGTKDFKWTEICGLPSNPSTRLTRCIHYAVGNFNPLVAQKAFEVLRAEKISLKELPKDAKGQTLLHHAALSGHPETIKYLIKAGLDIHAKNKDDWTPTSFVRYRMKRSSSISKDKELMEMMEIEPPWTTSLWNFFFSK